MKEPNKQQTASGCFILIDYDPDYAETSPAKLVDQNKPTPAVSRPPSSLIPFIIYYLM